MKIGLSMCLILSSVVSSCQIHWENSTGWTIYGYAGNNLFKISIDSLKGMDTIQLNQTSMIDYLSSAEVLHPKASVAWMGGYIATCSIQGVIRKVEISNYGGFFYDDLTRTYYQLPTDKIDGWLSYIQESFLMLSKKQARKTKS